MNRKTFLGILLVSIAGLSGLAQAELGNDVHIQSNSDPVRLEIDRRTFEEIQSFLDQGYPTVSVMLHGISLGVSINDLVYLAVKADVQRAQEFYDTAVALLPQLPGWSIQTEEDQSRYFQTYEASELGVQPTVAEVARRFFEESKRIAPFPPWFAGQFHIKASTDELVALLNDSFWYRQGTKDPSSPSSAPNRPVFISIYAEGAQIVIDSGAERIRDAQQRGVTDLPVVFVYNGIRNLPISRYGPDVKVKEIVNDFFQNGRMLTAVPEWKIGDHHMLGSVEELLEWAAKKSEVNPERWEKIIRDIQTNGFETPLLLSLFNSGEGGVWPNEPDRITAAAELGLTEVPVVFLYHDIGRPPCGQLIRSTALICSAAIAAGANSNICRESGTPTRGYVAPGGGAGFPPPPPPPPSR